jgi:hypothetical protein
MLRAVAVLAAIAAAMLALPCNAAQWKQVQKGAVGELWIDNASIKRLNGDVLFEYRIDYPRAQEEVGSKVKYQSTVTKAMVRCGTRTISIGPTMAYASKGGSGKVLSTHPPSPDEARFQPVEPRSSDESLYHHVCGVAKLTPALK